MAAPLATRSPTPTPTPTPGRSPMMRSSTASPVAFLSSTPTPTLSSPITPPPPPPPTLAPSATSSSAAALPSAAFRPPTSIVATPTVLHSPGTPSPHTVALHAITIQRETGVSPAGARQIAASQSLTSLGDQHHAHVYMRTTPTTPTPSPTTLA